MKTNTSTIQGKRILLVEDEGALRETVKNLLVLDEHTVVEANNGAEGYSLFVRNQFDLVLTDCVMPFVSGDELAMRIKRLAPRQPILMITAHRLKRSPLNPVDGVLDKPFEHAQLQNEIARLLQN